MAWGIAVGLITNIHYGWNWWPKSTGECFGDICSGVCVGIGFNLVVLEWIKGDKTESK